MSKIIYKLPYYRDWKISEEAEFLGRQKECLKISSHLCYGPEVQKLISEAKTIEQLNKIMSNARQNSSVFEHSEEKIVTKTPKN